MNTPPNSPFPIVHSPLIPPGYKQTEVGVIPEEWDCLQSSELANYLGGNAFKSDDDATTGVRWLKIANVGKQRIHWDSASFLPEHFGTQFKSYLLREGDVVMALTRPILDNELKVAKLAKSDVPALLNQRVAKIIASPRTDLDFVYYILQTRRFVDSMSDAMAGSDPPNIGSRTLGKILVAAPKEVAEQRAIATALSDVDGLLGGLERLIAKKRDLKQAAMQQLLTAQTRLPGFHGEWQVKRLGDVGKCLRGVSYQGDSDLSTHDTIHTKRLLRSNNVQNAVVVTDDVQFVNADRVSANQILRKEDILICMANGSKALVGKAGIFKLNDGHEYTFGAFMGCFRTNYTEANPAYVFYLLLTGRYRDHINNLLAGSSINNLRPSSIESLEFSMPPMPEQTAIAEVLSEMDGELAALEERREKTRALKQSMMQALLTGRIRLV
jgi:type I restriction enzyme S subunit